MKSAALLLAAGLFFLRIFYLGKTELFPEEAYYWNYAAHLDIGYLDHPPMVAWLIHLGTTVFGDREVGIRVFAVLSALATSFFTWKLTTFLYDREAAKQALLLVAVLPFFFMTGFMMTPDAPLTACWAGCLYYPRPCPAAGQTTRMAAVSASASASVCCRNTRSPWSASQRCFSWYSIRAARRWWRHPAPYAAVALASRSFSPGDPLECASHHWASFAFQSADRVAEARRFSTHELLAAILALLTPVGAILVWRDFADTWICPLKSTTASCLPASSRSHRWPFSSSSASPIGSN